MTRFLVLLGSLEASLMLNTIGNFYVLQIGLFTKRLAKTFYRVIHLTYSECNGNSMEQIYMLMTLDKIFSKTDTKSFF